MNKKRFLIYTTLMLPFLMWAHAVSTSDELFVSKMQSVELPSFFSSIFMSLALMIFTFIIISGVNITINRKNVKAQNLFWKKYDIRLFVIICTVGIVAFSFHYKPIESALCEEHDWNSDIKQFGVPIVYCSACKMTVENTWCRKCMITKPKYFKKNHSCFCDGKGSIVGYEGWLDYHKKKKCEKCDSTYYGSHICYFCKRHNKWFLQKHDCFYCEEHKSWFDYHHTCYYCLTCDEPHIASDRILDSGSYNGGHTVDEPHIASDRFHVSGSYNGGHTVIDKWSYWKKGDNCCFKCPRCGYSHSKYLQICRGRMAEATW